MEDIIANLHNVALENSGLSIQPGVSSGISSVNLDVPSMNAYSNGQLEANPILQGAIFLAYV